MNVNSFIKNAKLLMTVIIEQNNLPENRSDLGQLDVQPVQELDHAVLAGQQDG